MSDHTSIFQHIIHVDLMRGGAPSTPPPLPGKKLSSVFLHHTHAQLLGWVLPEGHGPVSRLVRPRFSADPWSGGVFPDRPLLWNN